MTADAEQHGPAIAVVGAGLRGTAYARRIRGTGRGRVVAVAEPDPVRRRRFAAEHRIPPERVFTDWREPAAAGDARTAVRLADGAVIATQDAEHAEPAVRPAGQGSHILLEKPMATTETDAERVVAAAERAGVMLAVCHVLRYTPYTRTFRRLVAGGRIGTPVSVQHLEPVGWSPTTPPRRVCAGHCAKDPTGAACTRATTTWSTTRW